MTKYPTKNEIILCKTIPTETDKNTIKSWKTIIWKRKENIPEKIKAIKILLIIMAENHKNITLKIKYRPQKSSACYIPKYNTIILKDCSIISALHELGHAIYGKSELKACSWSVKLFQHSFPVAFNKLHWEGHLLRL